jgi:hypothetical protein
LDEKQQPTLLCIKYMLWMALTQKWRKHSCLPGTSFLFLDYPHWSSNPLEGLNSMFSFKALSLAFSLNIGFCIGIYNALSCLNHSRSTASIFSHSEVYNLFLPGSLSSIYGLELMNLRFCPIFVLDAKWCQYWMVISTTCISIF